MQADRSNGERSQVRIDTDGALDLLDDPDDEAILAAGAALAVLDEDQAAEELMYIHQLVPEHFAALGFSNASRSAILLSTCKCASLLLERFAALRLSEASRSGIR